MKLSIITVNLNNLAGLKKTMQSVFEQTFTDYEYIIIDGGSTDGSKEYIEQVAQQDLEGFAWLRGSAKPSRSNPISYWVSEKDGGIFNAMNKGIKKATGDYVIFMNSGDYFFNKKVLQDVFKNDYDEDILYGNVKWWPKEFYGIYPDVLTFEHFVHNTIPHQGSFIKRDLFETVGLYDEHYKVNSDWNFFVMAIYKFNCSYRHLNTTISYCNTDGISLTAEGTEQTGKIRTEFIEKHFKAFYQDLINLYNSKEKMKKTDAMMEYRLVKYGIAFHHCFRKLQRIFYK